MSFAEKCVFIGNNFIGSCFSFQEFNGDKAIRTFVDFNIFNIHNIHF